MKRWLAVLVAATLLAGCQTARNPSDPFLRTTVPPPMTGQYAVAPPAYYTPGAAPAASAVVAPPSMAATPGSAPVYGTPAPAYGAASPSYGAPPPATYGSPPPANYGSPPPATYGAPPPATYGSPAPAYTPPTSAPPAAPPATYGAPPASTPSGPNRYAPSGGFNFPQSSLNGASPAGPGATSGSTGGSTLARNSAARSRLVQPAGSPTAASPGDAASAGSAANATDNSATDAAPAVAFVPQMSSSGVQQASFNQPVDPSGAAVAVGSPAGGSSAPAGPSTTASSAVASAPEITDLPAATGSDTLRAYGAPQSRLVFRRANPTSNPAGEVSLQ